MGQNFWASLSDSDILSPITCIFIARISFLSKAMSASVTVGLITGCTVICCPCVFAPIAVIPPPSAVATTIPATNAAANPAIFVILVFIVLLIGLRRHFAWVDFSPLRFLFFDGFRTGRIAFERFFYTTVCRFPDLVWIAVNDFFTHKQAPREILRSGVNQFDPKQALVGHRSAHRGVHDGPVAVV